MGVCTYRGSTVKAGSKGMCTDHGGTWTEDSAEEPGFSLIGEDFASAVKNTFDANSPETEEDLGGYLNRRASEDPAGLAWDVGSWAIPGGAAIRYAKPLGKLLSRAFLKRGPKTKWVNPTKVKGKIVPGSKYGNTPYIGITGGRYWPTLLGGAAVGTADQLGYSTPWNEPFSLAGKEASSQRDLTNLENAMAGIDKKTNAAEQKANAEKLATEEKKAEQDRIDNMSFYDKWKLGMKDPRTAALFGAGLRDIGSNIPGGNQLGKMQMELADADAAMAAANKPNAALHNVTKVSNKELMTRFTDKKTFLIGNKEEEERKATYKLGMYRALESALLKANLPADDVTIMRLLEEDSKRA